MLVSEGATLKVNGSLSSDQKLLENEVIFESDRLEPDFADTPGQWGTIWFFDGSLNNTINYATIKNGSIGILCDGNPNVATEKLKITNSQIYNNSSFGILGRNTSITAENVVINNAGQAAFAGTFGGKYNVTHATIANYWNGPRQFPALLLNNFITDENNTAIVTDLTQANFNNCIIYGNDNPEILLDEVEDASVVFNFKFTNCLIRFDNTNNNTLKGPNYDLNDTNHYAGTIFNQDPYFKNTNLNQLIIGEKSAAINKALQTFANQVPFDILNVNRTTTPDIGAYQHIVFPVED